jgi:hypothetical protein
MRLSGAHSDSSSRCHVIDGDTAAVVDVVYESDVNMQDSRMDGLRCIALV